MMKLSFEGNSISKSLANACFLGPPCHTELFSSAQDHLLISKHSVLGSDSLSWKTVK